MATDVESLTILLLQVLVVVSSIQVVIILIVLYYLTRLQDQIRGTSPAAPAREQPPRIRPVPVPEPAPPSPPPVQRNSSRAAGKSSSAVQILDNRQDIRGSLQAICDKFGLRDMIITTMDGLVVVSQSPGAAEEAARLTGIHRRGNSSDEKDLHFLPVTHRGDPLLVIVRAAGPLEGADRVAIEKDVAQILNWWL